MISVIRVSIEGIVAHIIRVIIVSLAAFSSSSAVFIFLLGGDSTAFVAMAPNLNECVFMDDSVLI